jgi:hypothetical protein
MGFVVGEVRLFATGIIAAEYAPGISGCARAVMQTEQRIWNGSNWAKFDGEITDELRSYYNEQFSSSASIDIPSQITPNQSSS